MSQSYYVAVLVARYQSWCFRKNCIGIDKKNNARKLHGENPSCPILPS